MPHRRTPRSSRSLAWATMFAALSLMLCAPLQVFPHPLGNFTINAFTSIEPARDRIRVRYVVDMAEIPAFQVLQKIGVEAENASESSSQTKLDAYLAEMVADYGANLVLTVDGKRIPLEATTKRISLPQGQGNLPTLRIECDFVAVFDERFSAASVEAARQVRFEDLNYRERVGWRETIVAPAASIVVFDSTVFSSSLTNELRNYPEDLLAAPLAERGAQFSFTAGVIPQGAAALLTREGRPASVAQPDKLAQLISLRELTFGVVITALLLAFGLGAMHALSPGHGKTVVGAYLVGSRGTARHAIFLGLTVTLTHTSSVFALGLVTYFASAYILPERLYPVLSFISGLIVVIIGASLFVRRLRSAIEPANFNRDNESGDALASPTVGGKDEDDASIHARSQGGIAMHTHGDGGRAHSHAPPSGGVTWKNLLALGISGGLLPCPSALVVLLAAVAAERAGFGLLLILSFSLGLAFTLSAIGMLFVYAGRFVKTGSPSGVLTRVLPPASAFVVMCVGVVICYGAIWESGLISGR